MQSGEHYILLKTTDNVYIRNRGTQGMGNIALWRTVAVQSQALSWELSDRHMQRTFWVNVFCEFRYILDQYRIAVDKVLADRVKVTDKSMLL